MLNSLKSKEASDISKEEALMIIKNYIGKEVDLIHRKMITEDSFDSPAWSEKQASLLGALRLANKILNFIPDQGK